MVRTRERNNNEQKSNSHFQKFIFLFNFSIYLFKTIPNVSTQLTIRKSSESRVSRMIKKRLEPLINVFFFFVHAFKFLTLSKKVTNLL